MNGKVTCTYMQTLCREDMTHLKSICVCVCVVSFPEEEPLDTV